MKTYYIFYFFLFFVLSMCSCAQNKSHGLKFSEEYKNYIGKKIIDTSNIIFVDSLVLKEGISNNVEINKFILSFRDTASSFIYTAYYELDGNYPKMKNSQPHKEYESAFFDYSKNQFTKLKFFKRTNDKIKYNLKLCMEYDDENKVIRIELFQYSRLGRSMIFTTFFEII